jgi:hypothetical protein
MKKTGRMARVYQKKLTLMYNSDGMNGDAMPSYLIHFKVTVLEFIHIR